MSGSRKELNGVVVDCVSHPKGGWSATVHFSEEVAVGTSLTPVTITNRRWCAGCTPENCAGCVYAAPVAQQPDRITPAELAERIERGEKWEVAQQPQAEAVPPNVTDAMVDAYLQANDAYWRETDTQPKPPMRWRTGNPKEATRVSLVAAIAAQGAKT